MAEEVQADLVEIGSKQSKLTTEQEGLTGNNYLIWQIEEPGGS